MHLYLMSRGIKHDIDRCMNEISGKYLPFKFENPMKKGELIPCQLQVAVRPIQLWEIVFPEEHKDLMLNTLLPDGKGGQTQHKKHKKFVWAIRKILGVDEIPEYKTDMAVPVYKQNCELVGIGIKKDYWVNIKTGERIYNPTEEQKKDCWEGL